MNSQLSFTAAASHREDLLRAARDPGYARAQRRPPRRAIPALLFGPRLRLRSRRGLSPRAALDARPNV